MSRTLYPVDENPDQAARSLFFVIYYVVSALQATEGDDFSGHVLYKILKTQHENASVIKISK